MDSSYDVFLSYARQDATRARPIAKALVNQGLSVFVDESGVHDFRSLTRLIGTALGNSKVMVALYSSTYPRRPACQVELTLAYLAGQQEGDPRRRVIVVNPEAGTDHIHPIELRDARHFSTTMAAMLAEHVKGLETPIGAVLPHTPPRWLPQPRPPSTVDDRLPEQWRLHSLLHPHTATLITGASAPGVAVVRGKNAEPFVVSYAERFSAAYPGGIYWFTSDGYPSEVENVRRALDPSADAGGDLSRLAVLIDQPCLWVCVGGDESMLAPCALGATILVTESTPASLILPDAGVNMVAMSTLETPTERERLAAFDLQVELATRVGVQQLTTTGGSLREALTSLHSLFETTRDVLRAYGPSAPAIEVPAKEALGILRPFLEKWHPRLSAHEHHRPASTSAWEHEQDWTDAATMRAELADLSGPLCAVVTKLSQISGSDLGTP